MTPTADAIIYNASELATLRPGDVAAGCAMADPGIVADGALALKGETILAVGSLEAVRSQVAVGPATVTIDAGGRLVTPGLIDAHTHLVFAGSRDDEFVQKVVDHRTYQEIEADGGGIPRTVSLTRRATADELLRQARAVARRMLAGGTTTIEAKSGYALEPEGESKLLRVMQALDLEGPAEIVSTLFGTHEVPGEYACDRDAYLRCVIEEMLPVAGRTGLARFCDCGTAYSDDQNAALLAAARTHGMKAKIHADEFAPLGAAELAARCSAVSAEHCLCSTPAGLNAMARAGVIAVLLPAVPLVHRLQGPVDGRRFIAHGVPVALGTDFNPSCLTESMQLVISLACYTYGLSPAEALTAATRNAAHAVGRGDRIGSLDTGKQADLVIWNVRNHRQLAERVGANLARTVIKRGRVVAGSEGAP